MLSRLVLVFSALLALVPGCSESGSSDASAPTESAPTEIAEEVLTTFYPATFFAERIADGLVPVVNPLAGLGDPATARPDTDTIARYQNARVVVVNGADFEQWVRTAPLARSRTVDASAGFEDRFITFQTRTHSHGTGGEHTHEGTDGHTWMDPALAIEQVRAIQAGLARGFPEHEDAFEANAAALVVELRGLDERFRLLTSELGSAALLSNHPAYAYPARTYGWDIADLDLDPESTDPAGVVAAAREALGEAEGPDPRLLLWESEPTDAIRDRLLNDLGVVSVVFSPIESRPDTGDFVSQMRENIARLRAALPRAPGE